MHVGPRSKERPSEAGVTLVGGLDSPAPASVDGAGLVTADGARWSLDWWIGDGERWYFPSRETTIRQRRLGIGPVIQTALRVGSGDVVHTAYPVVSGDAEATAVEIDNRGSVPVTLVLALRPYRPDGIVTDPAIDVSADEAVVVDDAVALVVPRPPFRRQADTGTDLASTLPAPDRSDDDSSGDDPVGEAETQATGHGANAVLVYPLPHGATLRVVVPGAGEDPITPDQLPPSDVVARGWDSVVNAGGRFRFPDDGVTQRANAARARLLLGDDVPAEPIRPFQYGPTLAALAAGGHDTEARRWLVALARSFPTSIPDASAAAELLSGVGLAAATADALELTEALLEPCAQLTYLVERSRPDPTTLARALDGLARLLVVAGQGAPAAELAGRVDELDTVPTIDLDGLQAMSGTSGDAGRFGLDDEIRPAARYWIAARSMLLVDRPDRRIDLLPNFPTAWRGGEVEVHDAATLYGTLSFAIRWHGAHPALLWEQTLRPAAGSGGSVVPVTLRCPGLDPTWHSTEPRGETLLAGAAEGLGVTPAAGDSFQ